MEAEVAKSCIKCGYTRRESDVAPDYACPACGVVYAKAEEAHARDQAARARSAAAAAIAQVKAAAAAAPDSPPSGPAGSRADALIQQLALEQQGQRRAPSPYRGMAMVAVVAFAVGFASAAGMYSAAAKFGKASAAKPAACPATPN